MPTYEYACLSCGHHVEVYQRFSDEPLTVCGVCGGPLRKVFHPAGILFKGSGFYATDSRSRRSGDGRSAGKDREKAAGGAGEAGKGSHGSGEGGTSGAGAGAGSDAASTSSPSSSSSSGSASGEKSA
jgi:putative FmdB family regulatory protein